MIIDRQINGNEQITSNCQANKNVQNTCNCQVNRNKWNVRKWKENHLDNYSHLCVRIWGYWLVRSVEQPNDSYTLLVSVDRLEILFEFSKFFVVSCFLSFGKLIDVRIKCVKTDDDILFIVVRFNHN
jgi:hypothetical protein